MKTTQSRWKSKTLWASIAAQLIAVGQLVGLWAKLGVDTGTVGDVVAGVLGIAATFGIINDPTNSTGV
jgi:uncharacterized membrane protein